MATHCEERERENSTTARVNALDKVHCNFYGRFRDDFFDFVWHSDG